MRNTTTLLPNPVEQQLQKLLLHDDFKRSPVLTKFLEYVVLTKLGGQEDEIKEYTIGTKALGRPADFNPQLDAVVRIHASRLRTILVQYYHNAGKDAPIIISIPKGTYVPVFEVNNGTLNQYIPPPIKLTQKKPFPLSTDGQIKPVLAVLPFHDLSPQQQSESFLISLGEQLSSDLAKFDHLSVKSFYATQKMDAVVDHLRDLKNEGIDYVLTGSLIVFNSTLRLNIQLLTVETGNILWSESYHRHQITDENVYDVQDEIISQVANTIADAPKMLSTLTKWRQLNGLPEDPVLDAIDLYFDYTYDYNSSKFEATLQAAEKAYKINSNHVLIVAILSKLYLDLYACAPEHNKDILEKGCELAKKAVSIDPRSQFAQKALAWALILGGDKHKVEETINHCVGINPTAASSLSTLGLGLIMMGEYEKGYTMIMKSLKLQKNPFACSKLGLSLYYYRNKNYELSSKWLELLPPFDTPFCRLLNIALDGNLKRKPVKEDEWMTQIRGQEKDIVGRIVLDPKLRTGIIDGWKRAGFVA